MLMPPKRADNIVRKSALGVSTSTSRAWGASKQQKYGRTVLTTPSLENVLTTYEGIAHQGVVVFDFPGEGVKGRIQGVRAVVPSVCLNLVRYHSQKEDS